MKPKNVPGFAVRRLFLFKMEMNIISKEAFMKHRALFSAFLLLATASPALHADPQIGKPAPHFALRGSDGKLYNLSDYKGRWVVLEWFNDQCPFIRKHYD